MDEFIKNIRSLYGDRGTAWLESLPKLVARKTQQWGLSDLVLMNNLTYHYVLSGMQNGQPIVLKMGLDAQALSKEIAALKVFQGFGAVSLIDQLDGALLLARAVPGSSLRSCFPEHDKRALQIMCDVMHVLHKAPYAAHNFQHISDWLAVFDNQSSVPVEYVNKARTLREKLLASIIKPVLLHGDLHHDNVLEHGNAWMVIDPKGVVGDPLFEVSAFICNPLSDLLARKDASIIIAERIVHCAHILKTDAQHIKEWCFIRAMAGWMWAHEDGLEDTLFKQLAKILLVLEV